MDTIVTPVTVITLDSTRIVHSIKADLVARYFPPVVRLVQYDMSLPVIAVSLMHNGQTYTLPSGAAANIRVHKPDATYVYNPALGCDSTRNIVYFEVTQAMAAANGDGLAIVEIVVDGDIAGTSLITLHFEENPVPEDAIESSDEWETIYELGERIIASTVTPVSTAAGMTDHNVVYLYTGTESGWNQGHMYYYNGTTWVDAGIAVTDTTLSVAGLAADAKKTGDEIADLKDGLSQDNTYAATMTANSKWPYASLMTVTQGITYSFRYNDLQVSSDAGAGEVYLWGETSAQRIISNIPLGETVTFTAAQTESVRVIVYLANGQTHRPKISYEFWVTETGRSLSAVVDGLTAVESDVADVKEDVSQVIDSVYVTDTASGSVASFPDGADNVPVKSLKVAIKPVQSGSGDPSPDNVRPISGHTQAKVTRCGKNLLKIVKSALTTNGITFTPNADGSLKVSGTATANAYFNVRNWVSVSAAGLPINAPLAISGGTTQVRYTVAYRNPDGTNTIEANDEGHGATVTIPSTDKNVYIAFRVLNGVTVDTTIYPMIRSASATDATFAPYQGQEVTVDLNGTRYGGTLDVTTGMLTVTHGIADLGDYNWDVATKNQNGWAQTSDISAKAMQNAQGIADIYCTELKPASATTVWGCTVDKTISVNTNGATQLYWSALVGMSAADAKAKLSGIKYVYPLATPQTVQLTVQEVKTLLGQNNIWNDCGDTDVEYRADTKLYSEYKVFRPIKRSHDSNKTAGDKVIKAIHGFMLSFATLADETAFWSGSHTYGSSSYSRNVGPCVYAISNNVKQLTFYWMTNDNRFIAGNSAFQLLENQDIIFKIDSITFHRKEVTLDGYTCFVFAAIEWGVIDENSTYAFHLFYDKKSIQYEKDLFAFSGILGANSHNTINFGVDGDSITAGNQWSYYVYNKLGYKTHHNVGVGSSQWQDEIVTYNGTTYYPQIYGQDGWLGMSDGWETITSAEEAQKRANNSAKNHVLKFIAEVDAGTYPDPDIFVFALGTNDDPTRLGTVDAAFASPSLPSVTDELLRTTTGAMRWCIQKLHTEYPECKIFWSTPIQSANDTRQNANITKIPVMTEVANRLSAKIIDQWNDSGISAIMEKASAYYLRDGVHPNANGVEAMGRLAVAELANY